MRVSSSSIRPSSFGLLVADPADHADHPAAVLEAHLRHADLRRGGGRHRLVDGPRRRRAPVRAGALRLRRAAGARTAGPARCAAGRRRAVEVRQEPRDHLIGDLGHHLLSCRASRPLECRPIEFDVVDDADDDRVDRGVLRGGGEPGRTALGEHHELIQARRPRCRSPPRSCPRATSVRCWATSGCRSSSLLPWNAWCFRVGDDRADDLGEKHVRLPSQPRAATSAGSPLTSACGRGITCTLTTSPTAFAAADAGVHRGRHRRDVAGQVDGAESAADLLPARVGDVRRLEGRVGRLHEARRAPSFRSSRLPFAPCASPRGAGRAAASRLVSSVRAACP